jgi:hypothetical protein
MLPAILDRKVVMGSEMNRPDCNMTVVGNKCAYMIITEGGQMMNYMEQ